MKKINLLLIFFIFISFIFVCLSIKRNGKEETPISVSEVIELYVPETEKSGDAILSLYREMQLEEVINYEIFRQGVAGFKQIDFRSKDILALIDFSRPSTEERLFIFNLETKETLFVTHVSHGRNSGENYATTFSNINGSYQSSLGFYVTGHTYQGKNGYSLVLEGLEEGINDRAKERAIVMHGASYSNPSIISSQGRLGRSLGCPAVPEALARPVIDTLKEGAVLYIYAEHPDYFNQSRFHTS